MPHLILPSDQPSEVTKLRLSKTKATRLPSCGRESKSGPPYTAPPCESIHSPTPHFHPGGLLVGDGDDDVHLFPVIYYLNLKSRLIVWPLWIELNSSPIILLKSLVAINHNESIESQRFPGKCVNFTDTWHLHHPFQAVLNWAGTHLGFPLRTQG